MTVTQARALMDDNQLLKRGSRVNAESSGLPCTIEQFLGGGGQGEVYRASLSGAPVAVKWYFAQSATAAQRAALEMLVKKAAPTERFLWPLELSTAPGVPGFGYIMALREPRYKGIADLMKRRIEPTFRALATAALDLSHSYLQLHSQGLCYRDISFGNVFFDPASGDVLICDNDNVAVDGDASIGVLGTPRFMAPEVVCNKARPGTQTDLFSLAVLLFYMFIVHHPLEGAREAAIKCLDLPAMTRLYGTEPVFIFDPDDQSNRPVPGLHDNALAFWPIYPQFLRDLFTQSFTVGIRDPQNGRVRERQWRAAAARLRNWIVYCLACGAENFYDPEQLKRSGGSLRPCWSCNQQVPLPPRIRLGAETVMLNHDSRLFPHHVDDQKPYDFSAPIAEVTRHPKDPKIWGLKNLCADKWVITTVAGSIRDVLPGQSLTLASGTKIRFGHAEGEVRL
jgi:DNA-binding helix-hairpin-helix protein with protein kinase domain